MKEREKYRLRGGLGKRWVNWVVEIWKPRPSMREEKLTKGKERREGGSFLAVDWAFTRVGEKVQGEGSGFGYGKISNEWIVMPHELVFFPFHFHMIELFLILQLFLSDFSITYKTNKAN